MKMLCLLRMLCLAMVAFVAASPAMARVIYVRSSGSDSQDGSSPAKAVRTVGRGSSLARAGDDVVVGPGTYREGSLFPSVFGHVRFLADRRGTYTGDPAGHVVIDATGFSAGFEVNGQLGVTIDGFVIYGAAVGIYAKSDSHQAVISNNVVSNCTSNGIYVQDSRSAVVFNNLVYNNARTGILITGNVDGSARAVILNNTVYQNGNRGIFFAGTDIGSPNGLVLNNVVQGNANAGIQVNVSSRDGYLSAGNVSFDNRFASGTPIDVTDITADPALVNPAGRDGILGGAGFADDSFQLSDRSSGQSVTSPAINIGSDVARRLALYRGSTRTDGKNDRGYVDAGYHYNNFTAPPAAPQARIRLSRLYVSLDKGSDTNDGATRSAPVGSLEKALDLARPGHQIRLLSGTYREGETIITAAKSGKPGRPLVIKGLGHVVLDAGGAQRGLTLTGVSDLVIEGVGVTGAIDNGIEIRNSSAASTSDMRSHGVTLRHCRMFGNGKRGLSVRDSSRVVIEDSRMETNGDRGIQMEASEANLEQCTIQDNDTGLWAFEGSTVTATRTNFLDNPGSGALIEGSAFALRGGVLRGSKDGGARFLAKSTGILEGVVIEGNRDLGVQVFSSSVRILDATIQNNRIGILGAIDSTVREPNEVSIEGSRICNSVASGVDLQDTALTLRNSTLCANGADGLRQQGHTATITSSIFEANLRVGLALRSVSAATVVDAEVVNNDGDGMQVTQSHLRMEGGQVHDNGRTGLLATQQSVVDIERTDFTDNPQESLLVQESELNLYGGTLRGSREGGIRYQNGSSGELQNVVITDNEDLGVLVVSSQVSIAGATIQRNRVGVFGTVQDTSPTANQLRIEDSMICTNTALGLELQDTALTLRESIVCANGSDGLRQKGGSLEISGCAFGDNMARGVSIADTSTASLRGVVAARNGNSGVQAINAGRFSLMEADVFDNVGDGVSIFDSRVEGLASARVYRNAASGVTVLRNTTPMAPLLVQGCHLHENGQEGMRLTGGNVRLQGVRFEDNGSDGISLADMGTITASEVRAVGNRVNGIEVTGALAMSVADAVLAENMGDGLTVLDARNSEVSNALVYNNGSTGIFIGGRQLLSPGAQVVGSTFYGNVNRGLLVDGDLAALSTTNVLVTRNIFRNNGNAGIQVNTARLVDYLGDYNVCTDPYGANTPVGAHDILLDPRFVNPVGEDFHLSQVAAGQALTSPAVDAGGISATAAAMDAYTTRTDQVADGGMVDIGYHYPPPTPTP